MFLPAAGYCPYGLLYVQGDYGFYWSSTPNGSRYAYNLNFNSNSLSVGTDTRHNGQSVRAVLNESAE